MIARFQGLLDLAVEGKIKNYFMIWEQGDGTRHSAYLNDSYIEMIGFVEWVKTRIIAQYS